MGNEIGMGFTSIGQRVVYAYRATYPEFLPIAAKEADEASQRLMYEFLDSTAEMIFRDPSLIGLSLEPDDAYRLGESYNRKSKLISGLRKAGRKIEDFYALLFGMGEFGSIEGERLIVEAGAVKYTAIALARLEGFGIESERGSVSTAFRIEGYPGIFPAWKLLSRLSRKFETKPVLSFSRCIFDREYPHAVKIFDALIEDGSAFALLKDYFARNGYSRTDFLDGEAAVDWAKTYGKKEEPLKWSWGERIHGGLSIRFDPTRKRQVVFGLRIPRFRELLLAFGEMEDSLKEFVTAKTKKCDGCGYCTQTDKTGTRKRNFVAVFTHRTYNLCALFPGFSYIWDNLDEKTVSDIIGFLGFIDRRFASDLRTPDQL